MRECEESGKDRAAMCSFCAPDASISAGEIRGRSHEYSTAYIVQARKQSIERQWRALRSEEATELQSDGTRGIGEEACRSSGNNHLLCINCMSGI